MSAELATAAVQRQDSVDPVSERFFVNMTNHLVWDDAAYGERPPDARGGTVLLSYAQLAKPVSRFSTVRRARPRSRRPWHACHVQLCAERVIT